MMKSFFNKGVAVLFGGLLFCASCGDADLFDTDKWSDKIDGWEPSVKATVANGSFSMWDLLKDTAKDAPIQNEDGMLVIKYLKENIYKQDDLSKIFELPLENVSIVAPSIEVPGDLLPDFSLSINEEKPLPEVSEDTELQGISADCELKEIMFNADLDITLPRLAACDYRVTINIPNLHLNENDGNAYSESFTVTKGIEGFQEKIPLNNALVKLGADRKIKLTVNMTLLPGGTISAGSLIDGIIVTLVDLEFVKAIGKIVIEPMEVSDNFDMNIDFLNEIGGAFRFENPQLNLIVQNKGIGVKTALNMSFWINEGIGKDKFTGEELTLNGNKENDEFVQEIATYKGSELADFLSLPPKGNIYCKGTVSSNGGTDDVIWANGAIHIGAEVRIPLMLSTTATEPGLTYRDTIKDIDIDSKIAEKLKSGSIEIFAKENQIPLDLTISKLKLVDENYGPLSTIEGAGKSIKGSSKGEKIELKLSAQNIKDLAKMKHILMEVTASTGGKVVSILASAELKFSLSITAQAQITDTDF